MTNIICRRSHVVRQGPGRLFVAISFLAACNGANDGGAAREPKGLLNRRLDLAVDVSQDLSYRMTATFSYEAGPESDVYFSVPHVDEAVSLDVTLDGRKVDNALIQVVPHPLYSGNVFRMTPETGAVAHGEHTLTVVAPRIENDEPWFAHWANWHPYLGDRAKPVPTTIEARVPVSLRAVASGRHVGERIEGATRISTWTSRNPQGWVFLAVGDYADTTFVENGQAIQVWVPPGGEDFDVRTLVEEPFGVLSFLEDKLGPAGMDTVRLAFIPWDELTNFSIDGLLVGTRATAARINDSPPYLRAFLAHELAHYWFGDLVNGHAEGARWISEGFAEYWRYRYEEAVGASSIFWQYRNQLLLSVFGWNEMPVLDAAEPAAAEELYYQKGPYVLYMLEQTVGRDAFDLTMRQFVDRFRGRDVTPADFFAVAGQVSGQDLSWFSGQWLDRPRGPVLSDPDARLSRNGDQYALELTITQQEPVYRIDLPIVIRTADGQDHTYVKTVEHTSDTFTFDLDTRPTRVTLDPDYHILKWFPLERLPIDFAAVWKDLGTGKSYHVGEGDAVWAPVRDWIAGQFGAEAIAADAVSADYLILLGDRAEQARKRLAPTLPDPEEGTLQAFLRRDADRPQQVVIGIEGTVTGDVPPIIPEAPLTFVVCRNGNVVGGHAAGMPALTREVASEE